MTGEVTTTEEEVVKSPEEELDINDDDVTETEDSETEDDDKEKPKVEKEEKEEVLETVSKSEFEELKEKYYQLAAENSLNQRRSNKDDDEPKEKKGYSEEDAIADLTSRDPRKVVNAIKQLAKEVAVEGDESIRGDSQYERAVKTHEAAVLRDFPEIRDNPEFQKVSGAIYNELEAEGRHPRNVYTATATAYALLQRRGKIGVAKEEPKPRLRIAPTKPTITKNGDGDVDDPDDPLGDFTQKDMDRIKLNAKRLGVPYEEMVKSLRKKMKEDSSYGRK